MPANSPIRDFLWRAVIWLPICFVAWYYTAALLTIPLTFLVDWIMVLLFPEYITAVEQNVRVLEIITTIPPPPQPGMVIPEGKTGELVFSINPLIYGYSIPLFTALVISSPGEEKIKWLKWFAGFTVLLIAQTWGIAFDILKTLLFNMPAAVSSKMSFSGYEKELVALGYQLGYLILPAVTPLVLWVGMHKLFLIDLTSVSYNNKV